MKKSPAARDGRNVTRTETRSDAPALKQGARSRKSVAGPGDPAGHLPTWPLGWYVVGRSIDWKPGTIRAGKLAGRPYVLFRTRENSLAALDAHCPHMGAHLAHGEVIGETLRCSLHHWRFDGGGRVQGEGFDCPTAAVWPVAEEFGLVFLYLDREHADPSNTPVPDLPRPLGHDDYVWTTGRPVELRTDWHCMMTNGFDMSHLSAVHNRRLIEPPVHAVVDGRRFELQYTSRVTGRGPSDLAMKWLTGDQVRVRQNCYGPIIVVETDLGYTRTTAVLGLLSTEKGVRAFGAFGVPRGFFAPLRLMLARWLYTAFLSRDFRVVEDMRLHLARADEGVRALADFLINLPRAD